MSDPASHRYGQHLSKEEVEQLVRPARQTTDLVSKWLRNHGIRDLEYTAAGDWISLSLPVRTAERLLGCEYHEFEHAEDGHVLVRTLSWSIPSYLHQHIDTIQPTTSFLRTMPQDRYGGVPPPEWETAGRMPTYDELVDEDKLDRGHLDIPELQDLPANPQPIDACNRLAVSPLCLRVLYGTLNYVPQATWSNKMGLVNFLGNVNNRSDVNMFLERYRPDAARAGAAHKIETVLVAGGDDQQTPNTEEQMKQKKGLEGAVDAETMIGVAHPTPLMAWNVGGRAQLIQRRAKASANEPYLEWLQYVLAQSTLPHVISISYADVEQTVPLSYAKRVCAGFAQLGARGVSVIVSAGDHGVGSEGACRSKDGTNRTEFMPSFPASCPFVTAVGATRHLDPVMVAFDGRSDFVSGKTPSSDP